MPLKTTLFLSLTFLLSCSLGNTASRETLYRGWGFQVRTPPGVTVREERGKGADFALYFFLTQGGRALLSAYAGNHPECPQLDMSFNCDEASMESETLIEKRREQEGRFSKEGVLILSQDNPALLHFWYSDLSSHEAALADRILASIQRVAPH